MRRTENISEAELAILKVLWELDGGSVRDVLNHPVLSGRAWAYTTVQTLLMRLTGKRILQREKHGRAFYFLAVVSRDEWIVARLDELADRVCEGSLMPLLSNLLRSAKLRAPDFANLRSMLDQLERA